MGMPTIFNRRPFQNEDESLMGEELTILYPASPAPLPETTPEQSFCGLALPEIGPTVMWTTALLLSVGSLFAAAAGCVVGAWILAVLGAFATICVFATGDMSNSDVSDSSIGPLYPPLFL